MRQRTRSLTSVAAAMTLATGVGAAGGTGAGAATAPNGLIAYSSWDANLNYDIYTVDPENPSAPPVQLTTDGRYNENPDWSPDGSKIVYDGWSTFAGPRIQVMDADPATDDFTVLSEPCAGIDCYGDFQPAWSPDGTRIAFVSSRPNADGTDNWSYELYVMDAAGEVGSLADATRLTTDPLPEFGVGIEDSQVTWSPDGTRIAFLSTGRGLDPDSCDLWVMDSQDLNGDGFGDNMGQLTFDESFNCDPFGDVSPQWSPNSSLIAFTSVRSGYFDIWVVNADDPTDLRNVTQTPTGYEDQPSWSPDGTQIIFRSSASGAYELYSLPVPPPPPAGPANARRAAAAGTAPTPTQLTFDGKTKQQPDWGPVPGSTAGTAMLTVSKRGRGRVHSAPAGIACGFDCSATFVAKAEVTLTATPRAGYRFGRWTGACTGTLSTCTLRMGKPRSVTATFVKT
jgi:Tol biopolymer transport system component